MFLQVKPSCFFKMKKDVIFIANGRAEYLSSKIINTNDVSYVNINQINKDNYMPIHCLGAFSDYIQAYVYAVCGTLLFLLKTKELTQLLQTYVAYEWFLNYFILKKNMKNIKRVFFANHYDRWAVLFDMLFAKKELILIQHGLLPENISLPYKLKNLSVIYALDKKSISNFKKIFDSKSTRFKIIDPSLNLIQTDTGIKSILIIGQPQSMDREIEIINALLNLIDAKIYIKPHPLYDDSRYRLINGVFLIEKKDYYPKVDLALSYESTLGLEYEASGVKVLWWKELDNETIITLVKEVFE